MTKSKPHSGMLSGDQPLGDAAEDRLRYAPFARQLADGVLSGSPAAGFVVGINGAWGSGKSTFLNFMYEHITSRSDASDEDLKVLVLRFNPWWFSGGGDLDRQFFAQLRSTLGKRADVYGKALVALDTLEAFTHVASIAGLDPVAAGVSNGAFAVIKGWLSRSKEARESRTPAEVKDEICKEMASKVCKIVVFIDDIDRLAPEEVRQVFRLVRAIADFPNVFYVLAYDKEVVARALVPDDVTRGHRYLEKMVQASFDLPNPGPKVIERVLAEELRRVLSFGGAIHVAEAGVSRETFSAIRGAVRHMRDVVRLVNALAVTYPPLHDEVDFDDFVVLEVVRIWAPEAYAHLRARPELYLRDPYDRWFEEAQTEARGAFDEVCGKDKPMGNLSRELLAHVFPRVAWAYDEHAKSEPFYERETSLRAWDPVILRNVLAFGPLADGLSAQFVTKFIGACSSESALRTLLEDGGARSDLAGEAHLEVLFARVEEHIGELSANQLVVLLRVLLGAGECPSEGGPFGEHEAHPLRALRSEQARSLRVAIYRHPLGRSARDALLSLAGEGPDLALMVDDVLFFAREHGELGATASSSTVCLAIDRVRELASTVALSCLPSISEERFWTSKRAYRVVQVLVFAGFAAQVEDALARDLERSDGVGRFIELFGLAYPLRFEAGANEYLRRLLRDVVDLAHVLGEIEKRVALDAGGPPNKYEHAAVNIKRCLADV